MEKKRMTVIYIIKVDCEGVAVDGSVLVVRSINEVIKSWIDAVLSTLGSEIKAVHYGKIDVTGLSDREALKSCVNCKIEKALQG